MMAFVLKKPVPTALPQTISKVSYPSSMLSRSLQRSSPLAPRFPLRPACCLAPSQQSSPQTICTVFSPSSMLSRSLPAKLSASCLAPSQLSKLFPRFPFRPACYLAPSQRNSPQAIFTLSSVQHFFSVQHAVSLPPSELSPSYFHGFLSVPHAVALPPSGALRKLFSRFPLRPACRLAPSQRSSLQAIWTVSSPSSMLSRSLSAKLAANYFHGFPSVVSLPSSEAPRKLFARFPLRPACCLAPSRRSSPRPRCTIVSRPACCLAPSQRSFPQAISTASSRPASGLAPSQRSFPKLFPRRHPVEHPVSLPPSEVSPSYFHGFIPSSIRSRSLPAAQFPQAISTASSRRASGLAPSQRSFSKLFPQAISPSYFHGFIPSSIRSRSLPAKFPLMTCVASHRLEIEK